MFNYGDVIKTNDYNYSNIKLLMFISNGGDQMTGLITNDANTELNNI